MRKYKQSELRSYVRTGYARDLGAAYLTPDAPEYGSLRQVGYSCGQIGITGALFEDEDGELWAVVGRSSALSYYA